MFTQVSSIRWPAESHDPAGASSSCQDGRRPGHSSTHQLQEQVPFELLVVNRLDGAPDRTYSTSVVPGGTLLGGMRRLMRLDDSFTFLYHEDPDYGPYLDTVNHVTGRPADHTYWELLANNPGGQPRRLSVGVGCYLPGENDQVTLNFTRW